MQLFNRCYCAEVCKRGLRCTESDVKDVSVANVLRFNRRVTWVQDYDVGCIRMVGTDNVEGTRCV